MAAVLKEWKNQSVVVVTSDGRILIGTLVGNDQVQNLILNDAYERVYSGMDEDFELMPLGLYVVRGDSLCLVGQEENEKTEKEKTEEEVVDDDDDNNDDGGDKQSSRLKKVPDSIRRGNPLPPLQQQQT